MAYREGYRPNGVVKFTTSNICPKCARKVLACCLSLRRAGNVVCVLLWLLAAAAVVQIRLTTRHTNNQTLQCVRIIQKVSSFRRSLWPREHASICTVALDTPTRALVRNRQGHVMHKRIINTCRWLQHFEPFISASHLLCAVTVTPLCGWISELARRRPAQHQPSAPAAGRWYLPCFSPAVIGTRQGTAIAAPWPLHPAAVPARLPACAGSWRTVLRPCQPTRCTSMMRQSNGPSRHKSHGRRTRTISSSKLMSCTGVGAVCCTLKTAANFALCC